MKNEFAFLYPSPRTVSFSGKSLDVCNVSFPLEIFKKYDFLFSHFGRHNNSRGLEIIFQERSSFDVEEYAIECGAARIVLGAASLRGQFYALSTLLQILSFHEGSGRMPAFTLRDAPETAFRGFMLAARPVGAPLVLDLRRLLLEIALLKFNHFALSPAAVGPGELKELAGLAQRAGMELMLLDGAPGYISILDSGLANDGDLPGVPVSGTDEWFVFFLDRCRRARVQGKKAVAWADHFLSHPEWIRKIPQDILVLNRAPAPERRDFIKTAVAPFIRHHIPQVLCPVLCGRDRILPDTRANIDRVQAAFTVSRTGKLAGIMFVSSAGILPEGAIMLYFQAGCLLWSGRRPGPESFSRWVLGRDEPDLFRVYSFLAQAEQQLPYTHLRYLFEDPLLAPYSRQGDSREVVAHFQKAALYLKKKAVAASELIGFIDFVQRLYEFVAAKVGFAIRLEALLSEKDGGEEIRRLATSLERGSLELQRQYLAMRHRHFPPDSIPEINNGFDNLLRRLQHLALSASSPVTREELLNELKSGLSGDPPVLGEDDGIW